MADLQTLCDLNGYGFYFEEGGCWGMALALADHFKKLGHEPTFRIQEDFVHAYVEVQGDYYDYTGLVNTHPDLPTKSKSDLLRAALRSGHSRDDILSDYQAAREMIEACDEPLIEATRLDELFGFGKNKKMNRSQIVARLATIEKRKGEIIRDMSKRAEVEQLSSEQRSLTQQLSIAMEGKLTEGEEFYTAYHGIGRSDFEGWEDGETYFAADYQEAASYCRIGNHCVVKCELRFKNPYRTDDYDWFAGAFEYIPELKVKGYDGVIFGDNSQFMTFSPRQFTVLQNLTKGEGYLSESAAQTLTLWHGGRNLQSDYLEVRAHKKGRWEHGPGLYLTTHRDTAVKYAKGGGRVYEVTIAIDPSKELNEVEISMDSATEFVERHVMQKFRSKIINDLESSHDRRGRLTASTLVNLCLNYEAIPNTKTDKLRRFLIDNGVDYTEVSRYGGRDETVYVVINPSIIQGVS